MTVHDESSDQSVRDALDKLVAEGDADQIATFLTEQGYQGERREAGSCPVSNYLYATTDERVYLDSRTWVGWDDEFPLPEVISQFVMRFDDGDYPDLAT